MHNTTNQSPQNSIIQFLWLVSSPWITKPKMWKHSKYSHLSRVFYFKFPDAKYAHKYQQLWRYTPSVTLWLCMFFSISGSDSYITLVACISFNPIFAPSNEEWHEAFLLCCYIENFKTKMNPNFKQNIFMLRKFKITWECFSINFTSILCIYSIKTI